MTKQHLLLIRRNNLKPSSPTCRKKYWRTKFNLRKKISSLNISKPKYKPWKMKESKFKRQTVCLKKNLLLITWTTWTWVKLQKTTIKHKMFIKIRLAKTLLKRMVSTEKNCKVKWWNKSNHQTDKMMRAKWTLAKSHLISIREKNFSPLAKFHTFLHKEATTIQSSTVKEHDFFE